ncbi:hypothetical protein SARC_18046 [Sphaeroforma arctica JP610]|uniref:Uncharacterized protein n=1 Tax=Sphaeroforma arctica JP610 TaxID=667725 RepID=A0A0L0EYE0_9EUKA|nr:hypothetical protein SARC_18046 [Sphaeroforma arctica JP610]KNC69445.1 hypothetical protein SARC_18046 [Sphaeroforma arctica JP610]|eukprot:XP_014143347.1 hypothetical protein SARC_18046 [Sphaeroforma arctica JP610]
MYPGPWHPITTLAHLLLSTDIPANQVCSQNGAELTQFLWQVTSIAMLEGAAGAVDSGVYFSDTRGVEITLFLDGIVS